MNDGSESTERSQGLPGATQRLRSEEALRRSEETHRQLFDEAPVAYHELDTAGRVVRVNQAELDLLSATSADVLGKPIWTFAEDPDEMRQAVHAKLSGQRAPERSYLRDFRTLDDRKVTVLVQDRLLRDDEGRILGVRSTLQDVTERQRMEARVAHLNAVLRAIRNVNQLITQAKDRATLIEGTCEHLVETRGYYSAWIALFGETGDLLHAAHAGDGASFSEFTDRLRDREFPACLRQALAMHEPVVIQDPDSFCAVCPLQCGSSGSGAMAVRLVHQDTSFGFLAVSLPAEWAGDRQEQELFEEVAGDVAFALHDMELEEQRDVAERALRENERRFQEVLHHSKDVMYKQDLEDGSYDYMSDAVEDALGYSPDHLVRLGLEGIQELIHPEDQDRVAAHRAELVRPLKPGAPSGQPRTIEFRMRASDGSYRWFQDSHVVLRDDAGRVRHLIGSARDITEQKLMEQERRVFEEQLRHAQKLESLGVLSGGIAHDFNNLLVGILGNISLALMDLPDLPQIRSALEQAETAAQRAADLTSQLLAYSGKGRFVVETLDLGAMVGEMANLLHTAISKRITLVRELADDLPRIEGDATQLRQVVMNLITNASEAIGDAPGTITLRTDVVRVDPDHCLLDEMSEPLADGEYVRLTVIDSGVGMDEQTLARMFDPFYTTKFTGRGLGLAAVLGIVRGHGGGVRVDSKPGGGTRFEVFLPVGEADPGKPQPATRQETGRDGGGLILLIDDERTVLTVTSRMLEGAGYGVLSAETSQEGVEMFRDRHEEIGLVLLDVMMPGASADRVLSQLLEIRPDARVMLLSGYSEEEATGQIPRQSIHGFLQKPYSAKTLVDAVEDVLGR